MRRTAAGKLRGLARATPCGRRTGLLREAAVVAGLLAFVAGCAHAPAPRPVPAVAPPRPGPAAAPAPPPPARPRPRPGYVARIDSLDDPAHSSLAGHRIVLDPGHGGYFKGSIGVNGTTEAEVNLGVALRLRELLRARGAVVKLTRETDRDFLSPADSTLRHDLDERVAITNRFAPELFLSIHHNADPGGAHDVNETQVYAQLGDEGPSADAGADLLRALTRNLGIEVTKLLPGNFAVVRGADAAAVLTEASYLTNPDVEARLRTPEGQQLEAEALCIGLSRFFARHAPVIESFTARTADGRADTLFTTATPRLAARVRGPFDAVTLRIDGAPVRTVRHGAIVRWARTPALAPGPHVATLDARMSGEGSARRRTIAFRVELPARALDLACADDAPWDGSGLLGVRVRALDATGHPTLAARRVRITHPGVRALAPAETTVTLVDGQGWAYFRRSARGAANARVRPLSLRARFVGDTTVAAARLAIGIARAEDAPRRTGFAMRMPGDAPLRDVPGTSADTATPGWINRDGFVSLAADSAGAAAAPAIPGERAWGETDEFPPRFTALAGGHLAGVRVVLDPEGGGDDAAGLGPSGTRAATLNLDVARALAVLLRAAGAEVALTRESDAAVSEVERVQIAESFHAQRYLRIGHSAAPPVAGHYFASGAGRAWGAQVALACTRLGLADSLPVHDVAKYPLTQASAVALYASLERIDRADGEARLLAPGALRAEAYALFTALAAERGASVDSVATTLDVRDAEGAPLPGALVTLGGALVVQADARGVVRLLRTEPGPLEAAFADSARKGRIVLLDSESSRILSGAR